MAINQNHTAEELNGVKCAVVEKNVSAERTEFLKNLLEGNSYTVVIANTPPPKVAPPKPAPPTPTDATATATATIPPPPPPPAEPTPPQPETFTVGVTDLTFNVINAIFGRLLRTSVGHTVTLAYWEQKENVANDEVPYFQK